MQQYGIINGLQYHIIQYKCQKQLKLIMLIKQCRKMLSIARLANACRININEYKSATRIDSKHLTSHLIFNFVNFPISSKYYGQELPKSVQQCMILAQKQQKLNEKCYLLEHLAELALKEPKLISHSLQNFMVKQLSKWKGDQSGRMQRIATVAWIIKTMNLRHKLSDLYQQIYQRIQNDEWFVNFDQSVKALQSFSDYEKSENKDAVMQKIERNLKITLDDAQMTYYQRICHSLIEAGRYRSPLWQKLQQFVIRNLSMPYTAKTFFDIFKSFAISGNGSVIFYQVCQDVIYRGHLLNSNVNLIRNNLGDYNSSGEFFALMAETYAIVNRCMSFPLSPDFLDYLYKSMLSSRVEYKEISSLTKLIKNLPSIEFHPKQIDTILLDIIKNKQFSEYHSLREIQELYVNVWDKYGHIPQKLQQNISQLVLKDLERHLLPLQKAIPMVQYIVMFDNGRKDNPQSKQNNTQMKLRLVKSLNSSLQKKLKYLPIQQAKAIKQLLKTTPLLQQKPENTFQFLLPNPSRTN